MVKRWAKIQGIYKNGKIEIHKKSLLSKIIFKEVSLTITLLSPFDVEGNMFQNVNVFKSW